MGLLTAGKPLTWEESLQYLEFVKEHGIEQFINIWLAYKDNQNDPIRWGDEIEYLLLHLPEDNDNNNNNNTNDNNKSNKGVKLCLRSKEIQDDTNEHMSNFSVSNRINNESLMDDEKCIVHPEYGSFMIETTPYCPYDDSGEDLLSVEKNMLYRREWIESSLKPNERLLALPAFPTLGSDEYCHPFTPSNGPIAQSKFITDALINPHPRFGTLTQNIRKRRGKNVDIRIPLFKDVNTSSDETEIYMDAMAFGMGCCCLQATYQASSLKEARYLNDHLSVLTPILMAMTAATPFFKGKVSDLDCRWTVISQSVDDRTDYEMFGTNQNDNNNEINNGDNSNQRRIYKSRYDTIDSFLGTKNDDCKCEYEDIELVYHEEYYNRMISAGVDESLAKHIAHLFIRDPLAIYSDILNVNDEDSSYHFETIQSTNWQNVRFKPPPPKKDNKNDIGWRVEFRSMEIQITEFENAAFCVFLALLTRAMLYYNLNFYVNISKIDENFKLAHKRNAVTDELFWWHFQSLDRPKDNNCTIEKCSIKDIMCGNDQNRGLIPIVIDYVNTYEDGTYYSESEKQQLFEYLDFIKQRASGEIMTAAQWLRQYVSNHKLYKQDSNISEALCRDITDVLDDIVHGRHEVPELIGKNINIAERRKTKIELNIPKIDKVSRRNTTDAVEAIATTTAGQSQTQTETSTHKETETTKKLDNKIQLDIVITNTGETETNGEKGGHSPAYGVSKSVSHNSTTPSFTKKSEFDESLIKKKDCCSLICSFFR